MKAAGDLVKTLYRDESMLDSTQEWVSTIVSRLCQDEGVQKSVQVNPKLSTLNPNSTFVSRLCKGGVHTTTFSEVKNPKPQSWDNRP